MLKQSGQIFELNKHIILPEENLPLSVCIYIPPSWKATKKNIYNSSNGPICIRRCYSIWNLNDFLFLKLIKHFYNFILTSSSIEIGKIILTTIYKYYFDIVLLSNDDEELGICRICCDYTNNCISLNVNELNEKREFFCLLQEEIENFFQFTYKNVLNDKEKGKKNNPNYSGYSICVCSSCGFDNHLSFTSWIPNKTIISAAADGNAFVYCPNSGLAVRIDVIAPGN